VRKCELCGAYFATKRDLKKHEEVCSRVRGKWDRLYREELKETRFNFSTLAELLKLSKEQLGKVPPFSKVAVRATLDGRKVYIHPELNHPLIYRCRRCKEPALFTSLEKLAEHVRREHGAEAKGA